MDVVLDRVRRYGDLYEGVLTTRQSLAKALRSISLAGGFAPAVPRRTRARAPATQRSSKAVPAPAQVLERPLRAPRRPVDARRDERVVDVADGEDPRVERERRRVEAVGVALPVEPLVVAADEAADVSPKPPSSRSSSLAPLGMLLDHGELLVGRARPASCRIRSGTDSLPMSCSRPPIASARSRLGGEAELLADLDGAERDAAGVLLGRGVLLVRAAASASGRARRGTPPPARRARRRAGRRRAARRRRSSAAGRPRPATPTMSDPGSSAKWPIHQPRSAGQHQRRRQRGRHPGDADHDDEVGRAARQQDTS